MRRAALGGLALALAFGCEPAAPKGRSVEVVGLGGDVAARVGEAQIPLAVVGKVAEAEQVAPRLAAERVVDDEVAAHGARELGLERRPPAAWLIRSAAARIVADRLAEDARRRGPPTDEEVKALSERHWLEVDRPPAVRTIHVVVLWPKDADTNPASKNAVRKLAASIRTAVSDASDADFESRAKAAVAAENAAHLDTRVERLPGIADDGRVVEGGGAMDAVFAKAASALAKPGDTSSVVETQFGAHVIRLLERLAEKRMPFEERRRAFAAEAYAQRARASLDALLERLRQEHPVAVSTAAEALMGEAAAATTASRDESGESGEGAP